MKYRFFAVLICGMLIVISCSKSKILNKPVAESYRLLSLMTYYKAISSKSNAVFGISSALPMNGLHDSNAVISFDGTFLDNSLKSVRGGNITVNGHSFGPKSNDQYNNNYLDKSIFGKKIALTFNKPENFLGTNSLGPNTTTDTLYIPKQLIVTSPVASLISIDSVSVGTKFTWAPDRENIANGVLIAIEYNAAHYNNSGIRTSYPKNVVNGKVIDDNGAFELDRSLFEGIPVGAEVSIIIGRANYKLFLDKSDVPFTIFAYNYKFGSFFYKE